MHSALARGLGLLFAALSVATIGVARLTYVDPQQIANGDAGLYTLQALRFRELLLAGDLRGVLELASLPLLRPPLHPLALGVWTALFGAEHAVVRLYGVFAAGLGLALCVGLARRVERDAGLWLGLGCVTVIAAGPLTMQMAFTPMTEPTALVGLAGALAVAMVNHHRPGWAAALATGCAVALAGLVRYNFWLMLPAALLAHHVWEHRRGLWDVAARAALLDRTRWLWVAPSLMLALVWQISDRRFLGQLALFLVNRGDNNGAGALSWNNLMWVPRTLYPFGLNVQGAGYALMVLFALGLLPALLDRELRRVLRLGAIEFELSLSTQPALRLMQSWVVVGLVALTLHPFKIIRNLYWMMPFVALCTVLPYARTRVRGGAAGPIVAGLFAALFAGRVTWQLVNRPAFTEDPTYFSNEEVRSALSRLEANLQGADTLAVIGWYAPLEPHVFEIWLRDRGQPTRVVVDWMPGAGFDSDQRELFLVPPGQQTRLVELLEPARAVTTTFVIVEVGAREAQSSPTPFEVNGNAYQATVQLAGLGLVEVEQVQLSRARLMLHVWRAGS